MQHFFTNLAESRNLAAISAGDRFQSDLLNWPDFRRIWENGRIYARAAAVLVCEFFGAYLSW